MPWDSSSLTGDVVLNPVATKDRQAQSPVVEPSSIPDTAVELAYWETIKDSADRDFFEAYLKQFPSGAFASLAKLKIEAIDKRAEQERQAAERQRAESDQLERERAAKAANDPTVVEIAKLEQPTLPTLTESMQTGELVVATQRELARIGCLAGRVDGVWGSGSQKALRAYANRQGVNLASAEPTSELLKGLQTIQNRVCPLACVDGMQERNGRCESDSAPGLSAFNGMWRLTRRATNSSCGWREIETQIFITDGEIAADTHWRGTISNNGRIRNQP